MTSEPKTKIVNPIRINSDEPLFDSEQLAGVIKKAMRDLSEQINRAFEDARKQFHGGYVLGPDAKAGIALLKRLDDACEDEIIMASPNTLALAKLMQDLLRNSSAGATTDEVFEPVTAQAAKQAISEDRSRAAKSKNAQARAYVIDEWEQRTDKGQSKNSFAKQYVKLFKNVEFLKITYGVSVTSDTIARDWLPKGKK